MMKLENRIYMALKELSLASDEVMTHRKIAKHLARMDLFKEPVRDWFYANESLPDHGKLIIAAIPTNHGEFIQACWRDEEFNGLYDCCGDDVGYDWDCVEKWTHIPD